MSEFSNGEVVRLKSGGPSMTITYIEDTPNPEDIFTPGIPFRVTIFCQWFDSKDALQTAFFYPENLLKV
ncbi:YodC family protein [Pseudomonas sp. SDT2931_S440]|uniref:DUF2158 domain-containing protein n=1 Tax=Pseudomonas brenneri TaxID=129817 RepID=A0A5B2UUT0_9PSED|nr:DUF2158 domain-containing protein [Pseudomonas brenneri]KAA2230524.1 DUF2158 domain-containing protein [Pseudomonas brenneri]TWR77400.1 DUF2158 domain-containing protein [Pseudomonas brenneri]GGL49772.1 hypothetical protein GCM10009091_34370 [Pseudomonas brenneri]SDU96504.1 Uncharacterized conserved protein YodC, DUF2158 family [Pseudomonas brenneri]